MLELQCHDGLKKTKKRKFGISIQGWRINLNLS